MEKWTMEGWVRSPAIAQMFVHHVKIAGQNAVMPWAMSGSLTGKSPAIYIEGSSSPR